MRRWSEMQAPRLSRFDVAMTCLSAAVEAALIWRYLGKRWGFHD